MQNVQLAAEEVITTPLADGWTGYTTLDVQTRILRFGRFPQKGFVSTVTFGNKRGDVKLAFLLNALADFALYAGVGYKTRRGMGQVCRVVG